MFLFEDLIENPASTTTFRSIYLFLKEKFSIYLELFEVGHLILNLAIVRRWLADCKNAARQTKLGCFF